MKNEVVLFESKEVYDAVNLVHVLLGDTNHASGGLKIQRVDGTWTVFCDLDALDSDAIQIINDKDEPKAKACCGGGGCAKAKAPSVSQEDRAAKASEVAEVPAVEDAKLPETKDIIALCHKCAKLIGAASTRQILTDVAGVSKVPDVSDDKKIEVVEALTNAIEAANG